MKIISFCLWGNQPKYCVGAIKNARLAQELFPDWVCRFYCGQSVPQPIIEALGDLDLSGEYIQILMSMNDGDWRMMLDRFQAASDSECEVMISRDCDSRLSAREKLAVDEWLASPAMFHTMHDHPHHSVPILGGLFGIKKGIFSEMLRYAKEWASTHESRWQCDQDFLTQVVWPIVRNDTMNHDEFYRHIWGGKPFPSPRSGLEFVGQVFDENEITVAEHQTMLKKALRI